MNRIAAESDAPRAVDESFAALLHRLDPATDPRVLHAARRAMHAVAQGHAALDLQELARESDNDAAAIEHWRAALQTSRWVATPDATEAAAADAPLVLEGDLLYLRRYREYERRLALGLQRIASHAPNIDDLAALAPLFAKLFPNAKAGDDQARAAALALARNLLLITGGPGTGKTTTLARLLVLLIARQHLLSVIEKDASDRPGGLPPFEKEGPGGICSAPRIALAAPTGRAADRMAQSMAQARDALHAAGVDATLLDALPTQARTLHRLLGPIPDRPRFRHDAAHPLAFDVVVVDEASMVDLPLMCKLVEAVADGATLVLVGDPDQLPSVEAGDVLASIVHAAGDDGTLPPTIETALAPLLGATPKSRRPRAGGDPWTLPLFDDDAQTPIGNTTAPRSTSNAPLAGHRVHLRRGWRQTEALDLAPLADAVRAGESERALTQLQTQSLRGVTFHPGLSDPLATSVREQLLAPWRALAQLDDPHAALEHAARVRLLTALRGGPQGAVQLNARIEETLAGIQRDRYFHGRLLLITENSYRHGLFNGDIGVCLRDAGGATVTWFANGSDVRAFHPGTLPAHEGAFAMTVHKAQGSEFDAVWLLLPQRDNRVLSRELVYTGITRARRELHVAGSAEVIEAALGRHVGRWSGLGWRLNAI